MDLCLIGLCRRCVSRSWQRTLQFAVDLHRRLSKRAILSSPDPLQARFSAAMRRIAATPVSLLHVACDWLRPHRDLHEVSLAAVDLLLRSGARVDAVDHNGDTAAHKLAQSCVAADEGMKLGDVGAASRYTGAIAVLGLLVDNNAHLDLLNDAGQTPVGLLGGLWPKVLAQLGYDTEASLEAVVRMH